MIYNIPYGAWPELKLAVIMRDFELRAGHHPKHLDRYNKVLHSRTRRSEMIETLRLNGAPMSALEIGEAINADPNKLTHALLKGFRAGVFIRTGRCGEYKYSVEVI